MKIVITRPEPAASATAKKLRQSGYDVIVSPVLEIVDTGAALPRRGFSALIITSANALNVLEQRGAINALQKLPVFVVGDTTAHKATALGFKHVFSASGNAGDLATLIIDHVAGLPKGLPDMLYACGVDSTPGMVAMLQNHSINITSFRAYKAVLVDQLTEKTAKLLQKNSPAEVLIYSARSARQFAHLAAAYTAGQPIDNIEILALSEQIKLALPKVWQARTFCARLPNEAALLALLEQRTQRHGYKN